MQKEIEIKFEIRPEDKIRDKLSGLGGVLVKSYKQKTYGFFSADSIDKGIFPRIRDENGQIVLTVKVKDLQKQSNDYFERKEYSMVISDMEAGIEILKILGFDKIRSFEKDREEWNFPNALVTVDKLYFGTFIEIEGSKGEIEKMVSRLGFKNRKRITKSYLALEDEYKSNNI